MAKLWDIPAECDDLHDQIRAKGYEAVYMPDAGIVQLRAGLSRKIQIWHEEVQAEVHELLMKVALYSIVKS